MSVIRPTIAVAVLVAAISCVGLAGAAPASLSVPISTAVFTVTCGFSHRNSDDPIRFPRRPGASHNHTYVGNGSTNAFSTVATLTAAPTTCDRTSDHSAYWMPTLYAGTRAVAPTEGLVYYRRTTTAALTPYPLGFRMIAGNMMSMKPQSLKVISWDCLGPRGIPTRGRVSPRPCARGSRLELNVRFPSCWNGRQLDSKDHMSHVRYPSAGACPQGFHVAVPALTLTYRFPPLPPKSRLTVASGRTFTAHADFINAWDPADLAQLTESCLNDPPARPCGQLPPRE